MFDRETGEKTLLFTIHGPVVFVFSSGGAPGMSARRLDDYAPTGAGP